MHKPPVLENKHLSCAKPSVKCRNCGVRPLFPQAFVWQCGRSWGASWQLLFTGRLPHFPQFSLAALHALRGWNHSVSRLQGKKDDKHLDHLFKLCGIVLWPRSCRSLWCGSDTGIHSSVKLTSHEGTNTCTGLLFFYKYVMSLRRWCTSLI